MAAQPLDVFISDQITMARTHGQKRSNEAHQSTTDPEARLYKKSYGEESKLAYLGHARIEIRNGLIHGHGHHAHEHAGATPLC